MRNLYTQKGMNVDRRIKFRHLDAFSAIARARSFKIAADQLNLTQPAISKTLKELEDILGVKVMERSRSGVSLTPQGEVFLQFAEQSTAALKHGATQSPSTRVEIHEGSHLDLTSRLRSGALDLVVGRLGKPDTMIGLSFQQLYSERVVAVANPDSPAVTVTDAAALAGFRVLYPPKDSAIRPLVARMLIAQGVPLFQGATEGAVGIMSRSEEVPSVATRTFTTLLHGL